jgi:hypothetical protein
VVLFCGLHLPEQIGQRRFIEHLGDAVAHLPHDPSGAARFNVLALFARLECGFARAEQRGSSKRMMDPMVIVEGGRLS